MVLALFIASSPSVFASPKLKSGYDRISASEVITNAVPVLALPLPLADVRLTGGPLKHAQELDAAYLLSASCRLIPQDLTRCSK